MLNLADKALLLGITYAFSLFLIKNQKFVDIPNWTYPTPIPPHQRPTALTELQYFSVDGFSLGELPMPG